FQPSEHGGTDWTFNWPRTLVSDAERARWRECTPQLFKRAVARSRIGRPGARGIRCSKADAVAIVKELGCLSRRPGKRRYRTRCTKVRPAGSSQPVRWSFFLGRLHRLFR